MLDNVANTVQEINRYLEGHNFKARDADGNDFMYGDDNSLRFKTGTVYGEVSIQVVRNGHANPSETIRILTDAQTVEAKHAIDRIIAKHTNSGFEVEHRTNGFPIEACLGCGKSWPCPEARVAE